MTLTKAPLLLVRDVILCILCKRHIACHDRVLEVILQAQLTVRVCAQNLFVHDESAHPAGGAEAAGSARGTMMEWVRKIQANLRSGNGAFLTLEANAARGVSGRRAASSASVAMLVLSGLVVLVLVGFALYDQVARRRSGGARATFDKVASA